MLIFIIYKPTEVTDIGGGHGYLSCANGVSLELCPSELSFGSDVIIKQPVDGSLVGSAPIRWTTRRDTATKTGVIIVLEGEGSGMLRYPERETGHRFRTGTSRGCRRVPNRRSIASSEAIVSSRL